MRTIYIRTNTVNGKQYVGQTSDFKRRERDWKKLGTSYSNKELNEDRSKYGLNVWNVKILDVVEDELGDDAERYYIEKYNTLYPNGYNKYGGGVKDFTFQMKEETKSKISKSLKGKSRMSEDGKKRNAEAARERFSKTVYQYTLDGKLVAVWKSAKEAARQLGLTQSNISACCNGGFFHKTRNKWVNRKQYNGYIWSYVPL